MSSPPDPKRRRPAGEKQERQARRGTNENHPCQVTQMLLGSMAQNGKAIFEIGTSNTPCTCSQNSEEALARAIVAANAQNVIRLGNLRHISVPPPSNIGAGFPYFPLPGNDSAASAPLAATHIPGMQSASSAPISNAAASFDTLLASFGGMVPPPPLSASSTAAGAAPPFLAPALMALPRSAAGPAAAAGLATLAPAVLEPPRPTVPGTKHPVALQMDMPTPGPGCILVHSPEDDTMISPYQCLARKQLEFFAAQVADLQAGAQGRNRPIQLGQVGVRCIWCSNVPHRLRHRAFAYYPSKLVGIYQASQNIVSGHLCKTCDKVPEGIRQELLHLKEKKSGSGGGKKYWVNSAQSLGICEAGDTYGRLQFQSISEEAADAASKPNAEADCGKPKAL